MDTELPVQIHLDHLRRREVRAVGGRDLVQESQPDRDPPLGRHWHRRGSGDEAGLDGGKQIVAQLAARGRH